MDEVVTCMCGHQEWVLGTNGTRCKKCDYWLEDRLISWEKVVETNQIIAKEKSEVEGE